MTVITTKKTAVLAGAAGIAVIIALTGCAAGASVHAEPESTDVTSSAAATPTTTTTTTTSASTAATGGRTSTSGTAAGTGSLRSTMCAASQLQGSLTSTPGGGSTGHHAYELVFRNTAPSPCTLQGWPGVSLVGKGNGTQLGAAATEDTSSAHGTVTIAAGSVAHAIVLVANAQDYDSCGATTADGFRVYPPGSKQSLFIDAGHRQLVACTVTAVRQLEVQAVQPGS